MKDRKCLIQQHKAVCRYNEYLCIILIYCFAPNNVAILGLKSPVIGNKFPFTVLSLLNFQHKFTIEINLENTR